MAIYSSEKDEQPVRDRLALERTRLANERTLLAYARTAIMLAATGATLLKLFEPTAQTVVLGWMLIAAAVVVGELGATRFRKLARSLK